MKQKSKGSLNSYAMMLLPHLRNPTKLRLLLCITIIGGWYAIFFAPLSEEMAETRALIDKDRKRVTVAHAIDQLKTKLARFQKLIPVGGDANEMRRHVTDHIRTTPLNLIDVKPGKAKVVGPFDAPVLSLSVEGKYKDIDELLAWVENDDRLLRVDALKLGPVAKNPSYLLANLMVVGLTDKAPTEAPASVGTKKNGTGGTASNTGVKPLRAGPGSSEDAGKTVGAVRKKIGGVRKKVVDSRKKASGVAGLPTTTPPTSPPEAK